MEEKKNSYDIKVAPSILAADFAHLADEIRRIEDAGADLLHVDIMDGHFVPNLSMGPAIVAAINRSTSLFLDVHLMIYNPFEYIERFVEAGADRITIHFEATEDVEETLKYIKKCNVQAGLAFCPETSDSMVLKYLDKCDLMLLMTVSPGFGGQSFIPDVVEKIRFTADMARKLNIHVGSCPCPSVPSGGKPIHRLELQVDGGINADTAKQCVEAGANVLVAGTYIFHSANAAQAIDSLKNCVH